MIVKCDNVICKRFSLKDKSNTLQPSLNVTAKDIKQTNLKPLPIPPSIYLCTAVEVKKN